MKSAAREGGGESRDRRKEHHVLVVLHINNIWGRGK